MADATIAVRAAAQGKCDRSRLMATIKHDDFEVLPSVLRSYVLLFAAECSAPDQREGLIRRAVAEPDAPAEAWVYQFRIKAAQNDIEGALSALEMAAKRVEPTKLKLTALDVIRVHRRLSKPEDRRRFLEALDQARWESRDPGGYIDTIWRELVLIYLARDDMNNAERVAKQVTDPRVLFSMRLDRRFDVVRARNPDGFDVSKAALFRLETDQKLLLERPNDSTVVGSVVDDLLLLGRAKEALVVADEALNRIPANTPNRNWLYDARSRALRSLNRGAEAQDALREGSRVQEGRREGAPNVSQTINLATTLRYGGRHEEALKLIKTLGANAPASPYGRMWIETTKVCALSALNRGDEAKAALAFTKAHQGDNPSAGVEALFCVGEVDAVAQAFAARLMNPNQRMDALVELSAFDPTPETPAQSERKQRFAAVRDHPVVQKAVAAVGRLEPKPLKYAGWSYF